MKLKPKVYISGPMRGLPDDNRPAFHVAAKRLRDAGYEVLSPAEMDDGEGDIRDWMRRDCNAVCDCHFIALLPGWQCSRGARAEAILGLVIGCKFLLLDGHGDMASLADIECRWVEMGIAAGLMRFACGLSRGRKAIAGGTP